MGCWWVGAGYRKTLLARAVAGEAGCRFSDERLGCGEMIGGGGRRGCANLLKQARSTRPRSLQRQLDSIGSARGQMAIGGSSEQEQT